MTEALATCELASAEFRKLELHRDELRSMRKPISSAQLGEALGG